MQPGKKRPQHWPDAALANLFSTGGCFVATAPRLARPSDYQRLIPDHLLSLKSSVLFQLLELALAPHDVNNRQTVGEGLKMQLGDFVLSSEAEHNMQEGSTTSQLQAGSRGGELCVHTWTRRHCRLTKHADMNCHRIQHFSVDGTFEKCRTTCSARDWPPDHRI